MWRIKYLIFTVRMRAGGCAFVGLTHTHPTVHRIGEQTLFKPSRILLRTDRCKNADTIFMAFTAHSGPKSLIQLSIHFSQTAGLLGRVISSSQGLYLNTGQHKHRITPNIHVLSGIPTHDPSVRASEDSSCLRPRGYYDHADTVSLLYQK
jgi:hypothetical protein